MYVRDVLQQSLCVFFNVSCTQTPHVARRKQLSTPVSASWLQDHGVINGDQPAEPKRLAEGCGVTTYKSKIGEGLLPRIELFTSYSDLYFKHYPKARDHVPSVTLTRHHCARMPCRTARRSAVLRRMRCLCASGLQSFGPVHGGPSFWMVEAQPIGSVLSGLWVDERFV